MGILNEKHGFAAYAMAEDDNCGAIYMCVSINKYTYVHTHLHTQSTYICTVRSTFS